MKPTRTLVLIANERDAELFVNDGPNKGLAPVSHFQKADEIEYADRQGREQAGPATGRHGMEPSTSPREQNRGAFAETVLAETAKQWGQGGYDRFVMCAPPQMLGELRNRIAGPLKAALVADLNKDLVGVAAADLPGHFADTIVF